ncbi:MAG TPA: nitrilase-related carbon-nitrogen hydrolase [Deinococcales bacterium]|nr:nitrilase-related carbon-nitrogen hydrolase [Deinococcales bacterium]
MTVSRVIEADTAHRVIKHAIIQSRPFKGRRAQNLAAFRQALEELRDAGERPDIVVLPEGAFTGYFLQGGVRELAVTAEHFAQELTEATSGVWDGPLDIIAGFYEQYDEDHYNSGLYLQLGGDGAGIRHVHRKVFLPTYGVFDEERFMSRGNRFDAFPTRFGKVAMLICEDAWHSISGTIAALHGAGIIYILNASPVRGLESSEPSNAAYWRNLVRGIAAEHGVFTVLASLVGFEGGKALTGASMLAHPDGHVIVEAPALDDACIVADVNLDALQAARYDNPLLADLRNTLPMVLPSLAEAVRK